MKISVAVKGLVDDKVLTIAFDNVKNSLWDDNFLVIFDHDLFKRAEFPRQEVLYVLYNEYDQPILTEVPTVEETPMGIDPYLLPPQPEGGITIDPDPVPEPEEPLTASDLRDM